ncbi:MAG: HAD-IA family hydrolase [Bacteroidia bacterium]|nr:HAD-IA family hydrolase [Bacteroidia bacterium]
MIRLNFDGVIFDLDGVITQTALVHSAAWKAMFDEYLRQREKQFNEPFIEFTHNDYLIFVDGKPRYKGVESFLASRKIKISYGTPEDMPGMETICGLGNRKNQAFNEVLAKQSVKTYPSTINLIKQLKEKNIKIGVASSSRNCKAVLERAGILALFDTRIDGDISAEKGLKGKPEPDIFTTACDNLNITYDRAIIVEDAVSGIQSGVKGNFGLVLGIARENNENELYINGADIVVKDLSEISIKKLNEWFVTGLEDDKWRLTYRDYSREKEKSRETLLTIGNGYFGSRGAMEETIAGLFNYPGTYMAGIYNKLSSKIGDRFIENEDFVNCPNWLFTTFKIDNDDWVDINKCEILRIERNLDFRNGILFRKMIIRDNHGRETLIESKRIASINNPHIAGLQYCITPLNYNADITIKSGLNGNIINDGVDRHRQLNQQHIMPVKQGNDDTLIHLAVTTTQSKITITQAAKFLLNFKQIENYSIKQNTGSVNMETKAKGEINKSIIIDKIVSLFTSKECVLKNIPEFTKNELNNITDFKALVNQNITAWNKIWKEADIIITGDRFSQRLIRLHIYHTMITASHNNIFIDSGIPARGLHGEAYRGHIFWDELFILPFYNVHFSEITKSVLMYRYRRLAQARKYAKEHDYAGAMFPWQSASSGAEETQIIHLNPKSDKWDPDYSSLQRHVSLAVAYNVFQYYNTTEDKNFLEKYGAEIFLEICRFWASKATFDEISGRYSITKVMGPDEFHEKYPDSKEGGLNDNAYTNLMAAWLFDKVEHLMNCINAKARKTLFDKIKFKEQEIVEWKNIRKKLYIPVSDHGIIAQYDGWFGLKELDWEHYRQKYGNISRMDRILKAEKKSHDEFKVSKQADMLMTFYNLHQDEVSALLYNLGYKMPENYIEKNLRYYLERTSHGSTLSRMVHSFIANIADDYALSWTLYKEALESDFVDIQGGTTAEGIHAGVMTGTVLLAMMNFAGIDFRQDIIRINPKLPKHWREINFSLTFKKIKYKFIVSHELVKIKTIAKKKQKVEIIFKNRKEVIRVNSWEQLT